MIQIIAPACTAAAAAASSSIIIVQFSCRLVFVSRPKVDECQVASLMSATGRAVERRQQTKSLPFPAWCVSERDQRGRSEDKLNNQSRDNQWPSSFSSNRRNHGRLLFLSFQSSSFSRLNSHTNSGQCRQAKCHCHCVRPKARYSSRFRACEVHHLHATWRNNLDSEQFGARAQVRDEKRLKVRSIAETPLAVTCPS